MDERLARLAAHHGIESGYHDVWGNWKEIPGETHRAILGAMGVEVGDAAAVEAALREHERMRWTTVVPGVCVMRRRDLERGLRIHMPESVLAPRLAWRVIEEGGERHEERFNPATLKPLEDYEHEGLRARALALPLPVDLPEGYHRIAILDGSTVLGEGMLVVAPDHCYLPARLAEGGRVWGPTVQLYGVTSERNAGIGDFGDLRRCAEIWGGRGAAIVGTNPLHAISLHAPGVASPYSPSSRLFFNPIYIDIEGVEDYADLMQAHPELEPAWNAEMRELRAGDIVDYDRVGAAKQRMLERLYAHFVARNPPGTTSRARQFAQFREAQGAALRRHAVHEALHRFHGKPWHAWPEEHRDPASESVRAFATEHAAEVGFQEYLQWQADLQLGAAQGRCRDLGMPIGLYADLAISIGPDGSEAWANQKLYALGACVGAPPDEFNTRGQDWGLPPLVPQRLQAAAYGPFIATLRANMHRAGALRIDHVMGLSRLWWVPHGAAADAGAYVRYPVDDMLGIVALESHRNRCLVVGEDLGTVSDEFRRKLAASRILSYKVLLFEREGRGFRASSSYPRQALVAWSTHDLPTFAGWWTEEDVRTRVALGQYDEGEAGRQREERREARWRLVERLVEEGLVPHGSVDPGGPVTEELAAAVQSFAARSACAVMVVQMEDVLGVPEQSNLPGTVTEHPNWRRRLPVPIEGWGKDARFKRMTRALSAIRGGRRSARGGPEQLDRAIIPRATYRLQLHGEFRFRDATALVPYLARLGVSHVYCSPYLRARPGSKHGYDIVDHDSLNPEIGTREEFEAFVAELERHGMMQLADIVPNHMGVLGADNARWQDLLENGPASVAASFFDIDWHPPSDGLANRVLLPVLGDHYGVELAAGKLVLQFEPERGAFAVHYYVHRLPIDPREYPRILAPAVKALELQGEALAHHAQALRSIQEAFSRLPRREEASRARIDERNLDKEVAKRRLAALARSNAAVARAIEEAVSGLNGRPDEPSSFDALHELLEAQAFRVAFWRVASDEINYRRFFDINDLAAIRQENPAVFEATHRFVIGLVNEGKVHGLRIDHPDGLYDPRAYFRSLVEACGKPPYVAIEKIVAPYENMPVEWTVHGTTGYRFANVVNGLFVDPAAEARFSRIYHAFIEDATPYEEIVRRARRLILQTSLASELTTLASRLARIARAERSTRDFTFNTLRAGLTEVLANFPVYRTYIDEQVRPDDRRYIDWAVTAARNESRAADASVFDFIHDVLTCDLPARSPTLAEEVRHFARKFQQVSAPVMAKGVEDTAFYRFNRLASLNDVGGDPGEFGFPPGRFHRASANRARHWPHTMLATSTHDNKRSEDVRARINVLSEMPAGWRLQLRKWSRMNEAHRAVVDEVHAPSRNDEYLLYQVLLGSFPPGQPRGADLEQYCERIVAYMRKATREAKVRTSWARVNEPYERATEAFIRAILTERPGNDFLEDFRHACIPVTWLGFLNSLSTTAVKYTSPGVPDCYQGNETWDFSLVDPDNRRPVDYGRRSDLLGEMERFGEAAPEAVLSQLFHRLHDGRAKLYVTWRLLQLRRAREPLFREGGYAALRVTGEKARHAVAFARRRGKEAAITVVPRLMSGLGVEPGTLPCGGIWDDARVDLPFLEEGDAVRDAITGRELRVTQGGLALGDVLAWAPVAVLTTT
ncbi:MAG TPA: malto-oligosyltrehalose synthase [Usitatibacter sp.]|jgi:(1->4)-alpha-D-glucan 1-alpha-D-glucosylmutase|nr:malto-oligosyltrehalose synthase [Usitatibacter sp.]